MGEIPTEALLTAGYAVFLLVIASGLELLARYSHRRTEGFHLAGFRYRNELDVWECPTGHHLRRTETDAPRRTLRYRAPAHACLACCIKQRCTDSDEGREIEHRLDSWLESEIRRFHRGISLVLLLLATFILTAEIIREMPARPASRIRLHGKLPGSPAKMAIPGWSGQTEGAPIVILAPEGG